MEWRGEAEVVQEETHLPQPPLAIAKGRETHPSSAEVFLPSSSDLAHSNDEAVFYNFSLICYISPLCYSPLEKHKEVLRP